MKNQSRFRSVVAFLLALLMLGSVLFGAILTVVQADNSATIRQRINGLQSEANKISGKRTALEKEISSKKSQSQSTIQKKSQIDQRIELTRQDIQNTNEQIREYNLLLAEKQEQLDEGLRKQAELNLAYKARIRSMEENGSVSYWSILFKANSFSDLLDRLDMIGEISTSDQIMLGKIRENNGVIAEAKAQMEADREALQKKTEELEKLTETLESQKKAAGELIAKLAEELKDLKGSYEELESQENAVRAKIIAEQARYEKALSQEQKSQLANDNSGNAAGGGGGFRCPVPAGSARVTDAYGYRRHPIYGYYGMHAGVDLAAPQGTPVYAIASGYVNISTYHSVNGNYVSMGHGNGYGSLYAHLDHAVVSAGDYVKQGQVIGYVGSTGWSTGAHLHFEIHLNGSTVNPMDYISLS
ncbi:MAG: peptidoglycan DD-metalloendopeptidase family protein [Oscillospiraceae bacterium]|nr:peptidoglycan DD-metalloendopeptidase family protein [Oscillospiraceae bacterium]